MPYDPNTGATIDEDDGDVAGDPIVVETGAPLPPCGVRVITDTSPELAVDLSVQAAEGRATVRSLFGKLNAQSGPETLMWVNGQAAVLDTPLKDGDRVVIAGKMAGG